MAKYDLVKWLGIKKKNKNEKNKQKITKEYYYDVHINLITPILSWLLLTYLHWLYIYKKKKIKIVSQHQ